MKVGLAYGKTGYDLVLPDACDVTVLRATAQPGGLRLEEALAAALACPVASPTLDHLARQAKSACVLICDSTRPVPNGRLLPPLLHTLRRSGLPREAITVLVATGLHRPNEGAELLEVIGDPSVLELATVHNHRARNADDHRRIGVSTSGAPILVDRRFADADLKLVVGLVEPHFMAGFSGGRKLVVPGIADEATIRQFHGAQMLADARARTGRMDDNPVHRFQLEAVRMLGPAYGINVVLGPDEASVHVTFGGIVASHRAAVELYLKHATCTARTRYPTVITSAAGYPLDATYYQTVKAMVSAALVVSPGGTIVVFSRCEQGLGSTEFVRAQQRLLRLGVTGFLAAIRGQPRAEIDEWQSQMLVRALQQAGRIQLYSEGLTEADFALTGVERCRHPESEIPALVHERRDPRVAVVPQGPYLLVKTMDDQDRSP